MFEYKGANRTTETYRLIENNRIEHHLDMPNSSIVEAQIEEDLRDEAEMQKLVDEGKLTRLVYHVTETGMKLERG